MRATQIMILGNNYDADRFFSFEEVLLSPSLMALLAGYMPTQLKIPFVNRDNSILFIL